MEKMAKATIMEITAPQADRKWDNFLRLVFDNS